MAGPAQLPKGRPPGTFTAGPGGADHRADCIGLFLSNGLRLRLGDLIGSSDRGGNGGQPGQVCHVGCGFAFDGGMFLADRFILSAEISDRAKDDRNGNIKNRTGRAPGFFLGFGYARCLRAGVCRCPGMLRAAGFFCVSPGARRAYAGAR